MINQLSIKNFAIIDDLTVQLNPGLTIVTGETGSGKSILLQALGVALGGKTSKILVRSGQPRAMVEVSTPLNDYRRIISANGHQKAFIDDEPKPIEPFRNHTQYLADFHGQHEQQVILKKESHIDYLDRFAQLEKESKSIQTIYQSIQSNNKQLQSAILSKQEKQDRLELIQFQLNEIESIDPKVGEDELLDQEYKKLYHQEEILASLQSIDTLLTQENQSPQTQLNDVQQQLNQLKKYDEELSPLGETIDSALISIQEVSSQIGDYLIKIDHDPERLIEVQERLQAIERLKRKYGGQLELVLMKKDELEKEIHHLLSSNQSISALESEIKSLEKQYIKEAIQLNKNRSKYAGKLARDVEEIMAKLNMSKAQFEARVSVIQASTSFVKVDGQSLQTFAKGIDQVEFYLSANPGEQLKPLTQIASGGETSRIMLAFKTVFQRTDMVETLIFDEIDTGISGETAEKVADCLKELSKDKQVICISHLPQITRKADQHLHVEKNVDHSQTYVSAQYLNEQQSETILTQFFNSTR